ncbi:MAG: hypothetical protein AAFX53_16985 [Bacteroidota bacterium]
MTTLIKFLLALLLTFFSLKGFATEQKDRGTKKEIPNALEEHSKDTLDTETTILIDTALETPVLKTYHYQNPIALDVFSPYRKNGLTTDKPKAIESK